MKKPPITDRTDGRIELSTSMTKDCTAGVFVTTGRSLLNDVNVCLGGFGTFTALHPPNTGDRQPILADGFPPEWETRSACGDMLKNYVLTTKSDGVEPRLGNTNWARRVFPSTRMLVAEMVGISDE